VNNNTNDQLFVSAATPVATGETNGAFSRYSHTFTIAGNVKPGNLAMCVLLRVTPTAGVMLAGCQLEPGTVATPFERRSYGQELALAQRYYLKSGPKGDGTTPAYATHGLASVFDSDSVDLTVHFPVSMRVAPTASFSNIAAFRGAGAGSAVIAMSDVGTTANVGIYRTDTGSHGYTVGSCSTVMNNNNTSGYIQYSAEL
jgi:hypothetical protein